MRTKQWMKIAALASAIGVTGTAFAAETMKVNDAATSSLGQTPETAGVGGNDKTQSENFDGWMNKHATAHFHATRHPIIEGYDPPEGWGWCYIDDIMLDSLSTGSRAASRLPDRE